LHCSRDWRFIFSFWYAVHSDWLLEVRMSTDPDVEDQPMNKIERATQNPLVPVDGAVSDVKSRQIYSLVAYYMILLIGSIALIAYMVWQKHAKSDDNELIVLMAFLMTGAVVGSVLYQIRVLFKFYINDKGKKFDSRWMGKYITAPVEAMGLSLAILSLIQGGVVVLGGSGIDFSKAKPFAIFGFGALVGFGIREVIGWLANLARSTFPTDSKTDQ
jgi:hypothetical protein